MIQLRGFLLAGRHAALTGVRGKRLVVLLFLSVLPLLAFAAIGGGGEPIRENEFHGVFHFLMLQFVVPFAALFLGTSVIGDELDGRTVTYLFTRPVDRGLLYLGRLLGTGLSFSVILGLLAAAALQSREVAMGEPPVDRALAIQLVVVGFWAHFALFACLRTLFKRALLAGMGYLLLIDLMVSKMPYVGVAKLSVWHQLLVIYVGRVGSDENSFRHLARSFHPAETPGGAWAFLLGMILVSALLGAWFTRTREYHVAGAVA